MLFKIICFFSIVINLLLLSLIFNEQPNISLQEDLLIVTNNEKQCIEENSNNLILSVNSIYGPDFLNGYSVIQVESKYVKDTFEFRYSNCFYDSYMNVRDDSSIDDAIGLYRSRGFSNVTIHKQPGQRFTTVTAKK